jgi:hypothetical protein
MMLLLRTSRLVFAWHLKFKSQKTFLFGIGWAGHLLFFPAGATPLQQWYIFDFISEWALVSAVFVCIYSSHFYWKLFSDRLMCSPGSKVYRETRTPGPWRNVRYLYGVHDYHRQDEHVKHHIPVQWKR